MNGEWQRNRRLKLRDLPRFDEVTRAQYRERLGEMVMAATSWADLDFRLAGAGFTTLRKGQGLVLANENGMMKLSDLGRDIRLKGLGERFKGGFAEHEKERTQAKAMEKARVPSQRKKATQEREPEKEAEEPPRPTPGQKEVSEEFEALRDASDKADMTYSLHSMGLASRDQVESAVRDMKRAQEKEDESKTFLDRVNRDLFRQKQPEEPSQEPERSAARQRRRDRGRGR